MSSHLLAFASRMLALAYVSRRAPGAMAYVQAGIHMAAVKCLRTASDVASGGVLRGVRVLDLSRILAGPFATQLMADSGAEVIKLESPRGDDTRTWGPPFVTDHDGGHREAAYYLSVNRSKSSITVDLATPAGRDVARRIAAQSDVIVENFRPGKLKEFGLDYDSLSQDNPGVIVASLTGFGSTGPDSHRAGYDVIAAAVGGLLSVTGTAAGEAAKPGVAVTGIMTGLFLYGAVTSALFERERSGLGQVIETSLLETQVATLANIAANYLMAGQEGRRWGTAHASIVPYQAFQTRDGEIVIGAMNDLQFSSLCRCLGVDFDQDDKFRKNSDRVANREELCSGLDAVLKTKSTSEWSDMFSKVTKAPFAYGPINNMKAVFSDPQVLARDMVQTMHHPQLGDLKTVGHPIKYSRTPCSIKSAPPLLGADTDSVLARVLGLSSLEIHQLRKQGAFGPTQN